MQDPKKKTWTKISGTCGKLLCGEARFPLGRVEISISPLELGDLPRVLKGVRYLVDFIKRMN